MAKQTDWTKVEEEAQLKFDTDGDVFTGIYKSAGENGGIPQFHFSGTGEFAGTEFFTNAGHDLLRLMADVPLGAEVRITRTGTLDTGHSSGTPMVTYMVEHRPVG